MIDHRLIVVAALLLWLPSCANFETYGGIAADKRRNMNDAQARGTMSATCDISLGSYFRVLTDEQREYAARICGGVTLDQIIKPVDIEPLTSKPTRSELIDKRKQYWNEP